MTSSRRAARAHVRLPSSTPGGTPAELYDADAPVWHDLDLYLAWMTKHGWEKHLPAEDRWQLMSRPGGLTYESDRRWLEGIAIHDGHPANRRNNAAASWGRQNGVTSWHRLREMGLIQ